MPIWHLKPCRSSASQARIERSITCAQNRLLPFNRIDSISGAKHGARGSALLLRGEPLPCPVQEAEAGCVVEILPLYLGGLELWRLARRRAGRCCSAAHVNVQARSRRVEMNARARTSVLCLLATCSALCRASIAYSSSCRCGRRRWWSPPRILCLISASQIPPRADIARLRSGTSELLGTAEVACAANFGELASVFRRGWR